MNPRAYIADIATKTPAKIAIVMGNDEFTFLELDAMVTRATAQLRQAGVGPRQYVVMPMANTVQWVVAYFGVLGCDAIAFLVPPDSSKDELAEIISGVSAEFALVSNDFDTEKVKSLSVSVGTILSLASDDKGDVVVTVAPSLSGSSKQPMTNAEDRSGDAFMRMLTSGSSGTRKQIMRTAEQMQFAYDSLCHFRAVSGDDVFLNVVPPHHIAGIGMILWSMQLGSTLVLEPEFIPAKVIQDVAEHRVTFMIMSPFAFGIIAKSFVSEKDDFSSLRCAFSAGAPMTEDVYSVFKEKCRVPLHELYGTTEIVFATVRIDDGSLTSGFVGYPAPGTSIRIFDDDFNEVPVGADGIIGVSSPSAVDSYWVGSKKNKEGFHGQYILSGDRGHLDSNGGLYLVGRSNLVINVAGRKVDAIEVEKVLGQHPGIAEAAVYARRSDATDEVAAAVVLSDVNVTAIEIMQWCGKHLAPYKVPKRIVFVTALPRDKNGKISRRELPLL